MDVRGTAAALRLAQHGDLPGLAFGRVSAQGVLTDQTVGVTVQEYVDMGAGRPGGEHAAVGAAQGEADDAVGGEGAGGHREGGRD